MSAAPPSPRPLPLDLDVEVAPELDAVLLTAAWVGDLAGSEVNVDYTGLFLGLAWTEGPVGRWMQSLGGFDPEPMTRALGLSPEARSHVDSAAATGSPPSLRSDVVSRSARALLRNAAALAREVGGEGRPLSPHHVLGAYLYRNPPEHETQLWRDWNLDADSWRREFLGFVGSVVPDEEKGWRAVHDAVGSTVGDGAPGAGGKGASTKGAPGSGAADADDASGAPAGPDPAAAAWGALEAFETDHEARQVLRAAQHAARLRPVSTANVQSAAPDPSPWIDTGHLFRALVVGAQAGGYLDLGALTRWLDDVWNGSPPDALAPLPPWPPDDTPIADGMEVAPELWRALTAARALAREISGTETVGVRHLLAQLLVDDELESHALMTRDDVAVPLLGIRSRVLTEWTRTHVNDVAGAWRACLVGRTPPTVAGFDADSADTGTDQLDVTRYATAFATIMAAEAVAPPLSIGVFGDWGSGKSFFMRLLEGETARLAAMDVRGDDGTRLFHRNVVTVRFNAWHYVDANLWASLVQAILQGLHDAMVTSGDEALMDEVLDRLELAKEDKAQAQEAVNEAQAALVARRREEREAKDEAVRKAQDLSEVRDQDVVAKVRDEILDGLSLSGVVDFMTGYVDLTEEERRALETLDGEARKRLGDVKDLVVEGRAATLRARSTTEWLVRAPLEPRDVLLLAGVVVGGALAIWALDALVASQVPTITAVVMEVGAAASMVVAWVRGHLRRIGRGLDQVERVRERVAEKEEAVRAEHQQAVAEAEGLVEDARRTLERKAADLAAARERLAEAERALRESGSVRRIARLVERRLEGRDYERHLGIVAAIRNDFETISRYLAAEPDARAEAARAEAGPDPDYRPVDRIVLYIDDLDRCPTDKVVSVLEAIHLLLAFELFVVVVGVDIRWAARSLQEKYPLHLQATHFEVSGNGGGRVEVATEGASALDYLEKIFQVPFWLPPMDEDASRNMINALVPAVRVAGDGAGDSGDDEGDGAAGEDDRGASPAGGVDGGATPADGAASGASGAPGDAAAGENTSAGETPEAGGTAPAAGAGDDPAAGDGVGGTGHDEAPADEAARLLSVDAGERDLMLRLAGAVGKSPRRLKRFVNTYRILKASLDALDRARFVSADGGAGGYGAAMALLAILTAAPREAIGVLRALRALPDAALLPDLVAFVEALEESPERAYVLEALAVYRAWTGVEGQDQPPVHELRYWAPEVARFSFRSGRL